MRIISKKKDYYDMAQQFGQDLKIVFMRDDSYIPIDSIEKNQFEKLLRGLVSVRRFQIREKKHLFNIAPVGVIFCGKAYRGVMIHHHEEKEYMFTENSLKVFYTYEEAEQFLAQYGLEFKEKAYRYYSFDLFGAAKTDAAAYRAHLSAQGTNEFADYVIGNRYVTFTISPSDITSPSYHDRSGRGNNVIANGYLDFLQFYRVLPPFNAYQELDMFISGTLPQSTAMPIQISDKDRIQQHGFDKFSFRKPKSK